MYYVGAFGILVSNSFLLWWAFQSFFCEFRMFLPFNIMVSIRKEVLMLLNNLQWINSHGSEFNGSFTQICFFFGLIVKLVRNIAIIPSLEHGLESSWINQLGCIYRRWWKRNNYFWILLVLQFWIAKFVGYWNEKLFLCWLWLTGKNERISPEIFCLLFFWMEIVFLSPHVIPCGHFVNPRECDFWGLLEEIGGSLLLWCGITIKLAFRLLGKTFCDCWNPLFSNGTKTFRSLIFCSVTFGDLKLCFSVHEIQVGTLFPLFSYHLWKRMNKA